MTLQDDLQVSSQTPWISLGSFTPGVMFSSRNSSPSVAFSLPHSETLTRFTKSTESGLMSGHDLEFFRDIPYE